MVDISKKISGFNRELEERHTSELAQRLGLPYIDLHNYPLTKEVLETIPIELVSRYQIVPYLKIGRSVKLGTVHPSDPAVKEFVDQLSKTSGLQFSICVISGSSFAYGVNSYKEAKQEVEDKVQKEVKEKEEVYESELGDINSISEVVKKVSTTRLLDVVIFGAVKLKASDVHMEPEEKDVLIRYRVDGVLQDVSHVSASHYHQLLSRIKFLCQIRMDSTNQPQDGRFSIKTPTGGNIDLRVSIMPSTFGEAVVIRILGQETSILRLDKLGFRSEALVAVRQSISKPNGMILTSGPTGSGKSSTLYAVLMELKKPDVKIITLEDPVEYRIEGIEQSQIKSEEGYTFAQALRASLRQDPDILMVGEIRDGETAEIAVQAALTGHLLISTIHANSAPAVFVRLLEMGVKPFLLSGSMNLVMAQRLIRKICANCREQYTPRPEVWQEVRDTLMPIKDRIEPSLQQFLLSPQVSLVRGKGCDKCGKSGYLGRQVVIEVLVPDSTIEGLVAKGASISEFERAAKTQGMVSMEQDGLIKVLKGETTIEEVWRVTKD
ncbi:MAG: GspE/PulE family protein [Patescibacteria group bacterium]|jgi:type II secretory ATPase GspE/PulE/Tfp pilus assembly ATPase PilB-like protein